ncbi:MAG: glutamyl-tRNA reductase [Limnochordaceae bacterium]|nr:glutamyl-tRNA reductase [Limnochordaceae bacterium]
MRAAYPLAAAGRSGAPGAGEGTRPAMVGFDYRTTPLEVRERLRLSTPEQVEQWLRNEGAGSVVLSTCHRIEVYVEEAGALDRVVRSLAHRSGMSERAIRVHAVQRAGEDAARHLAEVAAGLQSAIVGEPQILGQVRDAMEMARRVRPVGGVLSALWERAVRAGKRVRAETGLGRGSPSLVRAALRRAEEGGVQWDQAHLAVVGSGSMAMLALQEALERGVRRFTVCARRPERARDAAQAVIEGRRGLHREVELRAEGLQALPAVLRAADLVVSATAAPGAVIDAASLAGAAQRRNGKGALWVIDLAVPRDVEVPDPMPPGLIVLHIDDLGAGAGAFSGPPGAADLEAAHHIVGQEVAHFVEWLRQRQAAPEVVAMRRQAEEVRLAELEWALGRLDGELSPRAREVLEHLTRRLTNKLMHLPTVYLKELVAGPPCTEAQGSGGAGAARAAG